MLCWPYGYFTLARAYTEDTHTRLDSKYAIPVLVPRELRKIKQNSIGANHYNVIGC